MHARPLSLAVLFAAIGFAGCAPGDYRAETEVRPDGSVARTVQQADLPGTVEEIDERWGSRRASAPTDAAEWRTLVTDAPEARRNRRGVVASVVAPSAAELPETVRFGQAQALYADRYGLEVPEAVTTREATVMEYSVLTLYDWNETLTAGTDPVRMERARREAVRSAAELVGPALTEAVGEGTDASGLAEWIRTTGDDWTADLHALFLVEAAKPGRLRDIPADRFRAIARDYGLDAPDPREDPKGAQAAGVAFVDDLLRARVTRHGEPLAGEDLNRAKEALGLRGSPSLDVWNVAFAGRSGSAEAGQAAALSLLADYLGPTVWEEHALAYRHRTPGLLLETSGSVLHPGGGDEPAEVLFHFPLREAWPFGAPMTCRSAVPHPDRQRELFGEVLIADRAAAVRFLEAMEDESTRTAWNAAADAGDGAALRSLLP